LSKSWQKIEIFPDLRHETRQHGDVKVMFEGSTIMLGVFITLFYPYTMPNIYYCSTCMLLYPHLMAKLAQEMAENPDLRHETRQHGAVKV